MLSDILLTLAISAGAVIAAFWLHVLIGALQSDPKHKRRR